MTTRPRLNALSRLLCFQPHGWKQNSTSLRMECDPTRSQVLLTPLYSCQGSHLCRVPNSWTRAGRYSTELFLVFLATLLQKSSSEMRETSWFFLSVIFHTVRPPPQDSFLWHGWPQSLDADKPLSGPKEANLDANFQTLAYKLCKHSNWQQQVPFLACAIVSTFTVCVDLSCNLPA